MLENISIHMLLKLTQCPIFLTPQYILLVFIQTFNYFPICTIYFTSLNCAWCFGLCVLSADQIEEMVGLGHQFAKENYYYMLALVSYF